MSISALTSSAIYRPRSASAAAAAGNTPLPDPFGAATGGASEAGGRTTTDFTQMTRKQLADWVNGKIRSGEMSLDGTEAFVGMTMRMPVNGGPAGPDDSQRVDFTQLAQDGMSWADQHGDAASLKSLQAALATMQRYQGEVRGVDMSV